MIWADKAALWLSAALVVILWLLHSIGTPAEDAPVISTLQALSLLAEFWWAVASVTILPAWLLLRFLDAVAGGPARRRGTVRAKILR